MNYHHVLFTIYFYISEAHSSKMNQNSRAVFFGWMLILGHHVAIVTADPDLLDMSKSRLILSTTIRIEPKPNINYNETNKPENSYSRTDCKMKILARLTCGSTWRALYSKQITIFRRISRLFLRFSLISIFPSCGSFACEGRVVHTELMPHTCPKRYALSELVLLYYDTYSIIICTGRPRSIRLILFIEKIIIRRSHVWWSIRIRKQTEYCMYSFQFNHFPFRIIKCTNKTNTSPSTCT